MTLPPELSGNISSAFLALIAAGVTYIARKAHVMAGQVSRVYRTLFGEDQAPGVLEIVQKMQKKIAKHDHKFTRVYSALNIEDRREDDDD